MMTLHCEYISDNMLFLNTPHELDPLAKPFDYNADIVSPDLVHSITPHRDTRKEGFDVSASLVDISDTLEDDRDTSDTSSLMSTSSCETCANCGKYWCGYGGGKSGQDTSRVGLYTCTRCHLSICQMCSDEGRHTRHITFIIAYIVD